MTLTIDGTRRAWKRLPADDYAKLYPEKPKALRKMARELRQRGAGDAVFSVSEKELAKSAGVSYRTWQRYAPVFEEWGILEVKRWRYRTSGPVPNSYRVFLGAVIPADWKTREPPFKRSHR